MPLEQRAICQRLKVFRWKTELSQAQFAGLTGLYQPNYAGFEYARTQLNYPAAWKILNVFGMLNPDWLVSGQGKMVETRHFPFPAPNEIKVGERALFSEVFNSRLRSKYLESPILREISPALPVQWFFESSLPIGRMANVERFSQLLRAWIAELPDEKVIQFLNACFFHAASIFGRYPRDPDKEGVERRKAEMQKILDGRSAQGKIAVEKSMLTYVSIVDKTESVNQWHRLKQRIRNGASVPGDKSSLAKFLGVDLTQLSRWLANSKSAPEPGADYTLKMLQWVQERESRK